MSTQVPEDLQSFELEANNVKPHNINTQSLKNEFQKNNADIVTSPLVNSSQPIQDGSEVFVTKVMTSMEDTDNFLQDVKKAMGTTQSKVDVEFFLDDLRRGQLNFNNSRPASANPRLLDDQRTWKKNLNIMKGRDLKRRKPYPLHSNRRLENKMLSNYKVQTAKLAFDPSFQGCNVFQYERLLLSNMDLHIPYGNTAVENDDDDCREFSDSKPQLCDSKYPPQLCDSAQSIGNDNPFSAIMCGYPPTEKKEHLGILRPKSIEGVRFAQKRDPKLQPSLTKIQKKSSNKKIAKSFTNECVMAAALSEIKSTDNIRTSKSFGMNPAGRRFKSRIPMRTKTNVSQFGRQDSLMKPGERVTGYQDGLKRSVDSNATEKKFGYERTTNRSSIPKREPDTKSRTGYRRDLERQPRVYSSQDVNNKQSNVSESRVNRRMTETERRNYYRTESPGVTRKPRRGSDVKFDGNNRNDMVSSNIDISTNQPRTPYVQQSSLNTPPIPCEHISNYGSMMRPMTQRKPGSAIEKLAREFEYYNDNFAADFRDMDNVIRIKQKFSDRQSNVRQERARSAPYAVCRGISNETPIENRGNTRRLVETFNEFPQKFQSGIFKVHANLSPVTTSKITEICDSSPESASEATLPSVTTESSLFTINEDSREKLGNGTPSEKFGESKTVDGHGDIALNDSTLNNLEEIPAPEPMPSVERDTLIDSSSQHSLLESTEAPADMVAADEVILPIQHHDDIILNTLHVIENLPQVDEHPLVNFYVNSTDDKTDIQKSQADQQNSNASGESIDRQPAVVEASKTNWFDIHRQKLQMVYGPQSMATTKKDLVELETSKEKETEKTETVEITETVEEKEIIYQDVAKPEAKSVGEDDGDEASTCLGGPKYEEQVTENSQVCQEVISDEIESKGHQLETNTVLPNDNISPSDMEDSEENKTSSSNVDAVHVKPLMDSTSEKLEQNIEDSEENKTSSSNVDVKPLIDSTSEKLEKCQKTINRVQKLMDKYETSKIADASTSSTSKSSSPNYKKEVAAKPKVTPPISGIYQAGMHCSKMKKSIASDGSGSSTPNELNPPTKSPQEIHNSEKVIGAQDRGGPNEPQPSSEVSSTSGNSSRVQFRVMRDDDPEKSPFLTPTHSTTCGNIRSDSKELKTFVTAFENSQIVDFIGKTGNQARWVVDEATTPNTPSLSINSTTTVGDEHHLRSLPNVLDGSDETADRCVDTFRDLQGIIHRNLRQMGVVDSITEVTSINVQEDRSVSDTTDQDKVLLDESLVEKVPTVEVSSDVDKLINCEVDQATSESRHDAALCSIDRIEAVCKRVADNKILHIADMSEDSIESVEDVVEQEVKKEIHEVETTISSNVSLIDVLVKEEKQAEVIAVDDQHHVVVRKHSKLQDLQLLVANSESSAEETVMSIIEKAESQEICVLTKSEDSNDDTDTTRYDSDLESNLNLQKKVRFALDLLDGAANKRDYKKFMKGMPLKSCLKKREYDDESDVDQSLTNDSCLTLEKSQHHFNRGTPAKLRTNLTISSPVKDITPKTPSASTLEIIRTVVNLKNSISPHKKTEIDHIESIIENMNTSIESSLDNITKETQTLRDEFELVSLVRQVSEMFLPACGDSVLTAYNLITELQVKTEEKTAECQATLKRAIGLLGDVKSAICEQLRLQKLTKHKPMTHIDRRLRSLLTQCFAVQGDEYRDSFTKQNVCAPSEYAVYMHTAQFPGRNKRRPLRNNDGYNNMLPTSSRNNNDLFSHTVLPKDSMMVRSHQNKTKKKPNDGNEESNMKAPKTFHNLPLFHKLQDVSNPNTPKKSRNNSPQRAKKDYMSKPNTTNLTDAVDYINAQMAKLAKTSIPTSYNVNRMNTCGGFGSKKGADISVQYVNKKLRTSESTDNALQGYLSDLDSKYNSPGIMYETKCMDANKSLKTKVGKGKSSYPQDDSEMAVRDVDVYENVVNGTSIAYEFPKPKIEDPATNYRNRHNEISTFRPKKMKRFVSLAEAIPSVETMKALRRKPWDEDEPISDSTNVTPPGNPPGTINVSVTRPMVSIKGKPESTPNQSIKVKALEEMISQIKQAPKVAPATTSGKTEGSAPKSSVTTSYTLSKEQKALIEANLNPVKPTPRNVKPIGQTPINKKIRDILKTYEQQKKTVRALQKIIENTAKAGTVKGKFEECQKNISLAKKRETHTPKYPALREKSSKHRTLRSQNTQDVFALLSGKEEIHNDPRDSKFQGNVKDLTTVESQTTCKSGKQDWRKKTTKPTKKSSTANLNVTNSSVTSLSRRSNITFLYKPRAQPKDYVGPSTMSSSECNSLIDAASLALKNGQPISVNTLDSVISTRNSLVKSMRCAIDLLQQLDGVSHDYKPEQYLGLKEKVSSKMSRKTSTSSIKRQQPIVHSKGAMVKHRRMTETTRSARFTIGSNHGRAAILVEKHHGPHHVRPHTGNDFALLNITPEFVAPIKSEYPRRDTMTTVPVSPSYLERLVTEIETPEIRPLLTCTEEGCGVCQQVAGKKKMADDAILPYLSDPNAKYPNVVMAYPVMRQPPTRDHMPIEQNRPVVTPQSFTTTPPRSLHPAPTRSQMLRQTSIGISRVGSPRRMPLASTSRRSTVSAGNSEKPTSSATQSKFQRPAAKRDLSKLVRVESAPKPLDRNNSTKLSKKMAPQGKKSAMPTSPKPQIAIGRQNRTRNLMATRNINPQFERRYRHADIPRNDGPQVTQPSSCPVNPIPAALAQSGNLSQYVERIEQRFLGTFLLPAEQKIGAYAFLEREIKQALEAIKPENLDTRGKFKKPDLKSKKKKSPRGEKGLFQSCLKLRAECPSFDAENTTKIISLNIKGENMPKFMSENDNEDIYKMTSVDKKTENTCKLSPVDESTEDDYKTEYAEEIAVDDNFEDAKDENVPEMEEVYEEKSMDVAESPDVEESIAVEKPFAVETEELRQELNEVIANIERADAITDVLTKKKMETLYTKGSKHIIDKKKSYTDLHMVYDELNDVVGGINSADILCNQNKEPIDKSESDVADVYPVKSIKENINISKEYSDSRINLKVAEQDVKILENAQEIDKLKEDFIDCIDSDLELGVLKMADNVSDELIPAKKKARLFPRPTARFRTKISKHLRRPAPKFLVLPWIHPTFSFQSSAHLKQIKTKIDKYHKKRDLIDRATTVTSQVRVTSKSSLGRKSQSMISLNDTNELTINKSKIYSCSSTTVKEFHKSTNILDNINQVLNSIDKKYNEMKKLVAGQKCEIVPECNSNASISLSLDEECESLCNRITTTNHRKGTVPRVCHNLTHVNYVLTFQYVKQEHLTAQLYYIKIYNRRNLVESVTMTMLNVFTADKKNQKHESPEIYNSRKITSRKIPDILEFLDILKQMSIENLLTVTWYKCKSKVAETIYECQTYFPIRFYCQISLSAEMPVPLSTRLTKSTEDLNNILDSSKLYECPKIISLPNYRDYAMKPKHNVNPYCEISEEKPIRNNLKRFNNICQNLVVNFNIVRHFSKENRIGKNHKYVRRKGFKQLVFGNKSSLNLSMTDCDEIRSYWFILISVYTVTFVLSFMCLTLNYRCD